MSPAIVRVPTTASSTTAAPAEVPPLLWQIYQARGVQNPDEIDRDLARIIPPSAMQGIDRAVELIADAMSAQQRILFVGDFDADGATSCALGVLALRSMGHAAVDFLVPNRFTFGYGLTPEIVEVARQRSPQLLITVDNGISSVQGVAAAKDLGWRVVVTDHHLAGDTLPPADALVNPNLPDNAFPSKALAGVGVIFYVMVALRSHLRQRGWFAQQKRQEPVMAEFLDLVALGTVADVVPLDDNNRRLVHHGLARIRAGRCRPGISALLQVAGRDPAAVQAADMGFFVGPRLNAAGRLDDMSVGIRCLLSEDVDTARRHAEELDRLNRTRRRIEQDMKLQAESMLSDAQLDAPDALPWGLCLHHRDWHQGVIGILASRIKEKLHRPVIVFADAGGGQLKGSGRSIHGLHIRDALDELAVRHPAVLQKFGGHAMAAGMTIRAADLALFSAAFDAIVRSYLRSTDLLAEIRSDGELASADLNLDTARAIAEGGPWGQGFEEPIFDGCFDVLDARVVGERHWKLRLRPVDSADPIDAIAFNAVEGMPVVPPGIVAAYQLEQNAWRGRVSLQLRVLHMAPAEA